MTVHTAPVKPPVGGYVDQRTNDPAMCVRDVGLAIAAVLPRLPALPLDSEAYREMLGRQLIRELGLAGYVVEFRR